MEDTGKPGRSRRGLASPSVSGERRREIARAGGRAAHEQGLAHEWTRETAREAGRQGGVASGIARKAKREALARQVDDSGTEALK